MTHINGSSLCNLLSSLILTRKLCLMILGALGYMYIKLDPKLNALLQPSVCLHWAGPGDCRVSPLSRPWRLPCVSTEPALETAVTARVLAVSNEACDIQLHDALNIYLKIKQPWIWVLSVTSVTSASQEQTACQKQSAYQKRQIIYMYMSILLSIKWYIIWWQLLIIHGIARCVLVKWPTNPLTH